MTRWKLTIEYDGRPFHGWQWQKTGRSVQQALDEAVAGFCGEEISVQGAGRTDAGVHALAQVAHVDIAKVTDADTVRDALNAHLRPEPIVILDAEAVDERFHARFSATGRRYRYRIVNRRPPLALEAGRAWWVPVPLDHVRMADGAARLVGHHDFNAFRSTSCQAEHANKTLDEFTVARDGAEIVLEVAARSFLHNQVRIMVGTLRLVGEGKWTPDDVARALASVDRREAGPTAPPDGLYLAGVSYE